MTTQKTKRVRLTSTRLTNFRTVCEAILTKFQMAQRRRTPLSQAYHECTQEILKADVTVTQRNELLVYRQGVRDFLWRTEAHWQLYLRGIRMEDASLASRVITKMRANGHAVSWDEVIGRHEWRSSPGYAFEETAHRTRPELFLLAHYPSEQVDPVLHAIAEIEKETGKAVHNV